MQNIIFFSSSVSFLNEIILQKCYEIIEQNIATPSLVFHRIVTPTFPVAVQSKIAVSPSL
jgi:hypothetical protein